MHQNILLHWKLNFSATNHVNANAFNFLQRSIIQGEKSINPAIGAFKLEGKAPCICLHDALTALIVDPNQFSTGKKCKIAFFKFSVNLPDAE